MKPSRWKHRLLTTLIILAVWLILVKLRPMIILPHCASDPTTCSAAGINPLDRSAMGENSSTAEDLSTATQFVAGLFCLALPWLFWLRKSSTPGRWWLALEDFLIIGQIVALNGALTEAIRLVVQRPRPYVYENPAFYGQELQNYTSFVSGHTSFSTASVAAFVVVLIYRKASRRTIATVATLGGLFAVSTGALRVIAGRHFVTDTLAAILCGLISAALVAVTCDRDKQLPAEDFSRRHS